MDYKFETKELKRRVVSGIVCGMVALFLGVSALVFMFAARQYLIGGILVAVFIAPIIIWRIIYSHADKTIYKRIERSPNAITAISIVERCTLKNGQKNNNRPVYLTTVFTGDDCGDKIPYRLNESCRQWKRGDFVQIKFIKEQYQECSIIRKAEFEEYKSQFSLDYWEGYNGDGSDLLSDEEDFAHNE